jgi:hypothetical protein
LQTHDFLFSQINVTGAALQNGDRANLGASNRYSSARSLLPRRRRRRRRRKRKKKKRRK